MMRRVSLPPRSALLLVWVLAGPVSAAATESPMHCSSYTVGADTHTECSPSPSAPPGTTIRCQNYTVGIDTHAECSPVPSTRLALPRGKIPGPPPASFPRCYTYQIGSASYTECR
jgi:hypothetical protein